MAHRVFKADRLSELFSVESKQRSCVNIKLLAPVQTVKGVAAWFAQISSSLVFINGSRNQMCSLLVMWYLAYV